MNPLALLLLFAATIPARADTAFVQELLADYTRYDDLCRGGAGDDMNTWQACGARSYIGALLYEQGVCHGRQGQAEYQKDWHACAADSETWPKPAFRD